MRLSRLKPLFSILVFLYLPLAGCGGSIPPNLGREAYKLQPYSNYHGGDAALLYLVHIDRLPQPAEYGYTHKGRSNLTLDKRKVAYYVGEWMRPGYKRASIPLRATPGRHRIRLQGEREIDTPQDGSVYDPVNYPKKFITDISDFSADLGALEVWVLLAFFDGEQYGYAMFKLGERGKLKRLPPLQPGEETRIGDRRVSSLIIKPFREILNMIVEDANK